PEWHPSRLYQNAARPKGSRQFGSLYRGHERGALMPSNLFQPGNKIGAAGKPRGTKNRLAHTVLKDLLSVWEEPIAEGKTITRGVAALRIMSRERPSDFCQLYGGLVPREFWLSNNTTAELDDGELDALIDQMRQRLLAAREEKSLDEAARMRMIEHVN